MHSRMNDMTFWHSAACEQTLLKRQLTASHSFVILIALTLHNYTAH